MANQVVLMQARIPADLHGRVVKLAAKTNVSLNQLIVQALDQLVEHKPKK